MINWGKGWRICGSPVSNQKEGCDDMESLVFAAADAGRFFYIIQAGNIAIIFVNNLLC
jgi:hypothetical protein